MDEPRGRSCAPVWWARTPGGGWAQRTALLQPADEVDDCNAPLSWRGKVEESEAGGGTVKRQSLKEREGGKHPLFYANEEEEEGCCCQCVTRWCPVCLQSWLPPVQPCCDAARPPDCGPWRAGSTSDLYETLPSCSWTTPGRVNNTGEFMIRW